MFTPNAAALATALMTPERKGFALSLVYGGMTVAQAIGIPVSTWIAHNCGWRYAFAFVVFFGVVGIFMLGTLPNHGAERKPTAKPDEAITKRIAWPIIGLLATSFLIIVSEFSVYSYISVILSDTRIDGRPILSIVLFAFGIGAILGNIATGVLTDRFGPTIVLLSAVSAQTMLFTAMIFLRDDGMAAILLGFGWGVMGYIYLIPIQYRLLSRARHGQSFVLAINGSLTHIGVAAGAVIGGLAMGSGGMPLLAGVSVGMAVLGLAVAAIFMPDRRDTLSSSIKDMKT
jgi:predicted MFS family arabinose efflux permease